MLSILGSGILGILLLFYAKNLIFFDNCGQIFLWNNFTNTLKNNDLAVIIIAIIFLFLKGIIWIEINW